MSEDFTETTWLKIDPQCKYILSFDRQLSDVEAENITYRIKQWLTDNTMPILILSEGVKLVKLEKVESQPHE